MEIHAGLFAEHADHNGQNDSHQCSAGRGVTGHHHGNQHHQWNQQIPVTQHQFKEVGDLFRRQTFQPVTLCFQMHHDHNAGEVQESRNNGCNDNIGIRDTGHFRHQESRSTHNGRHDLSAGGGCRFYCGGKLRPIAHFFHHRNGKAAGAYRVGYRAAGDGTLQSAGDNSNLGRTAGCFAGQTVGDINKELPDTGAFQKCAEQNKQENKCGTHRQRRTDDPFCGEIQMGGNSLDGKTAMPKIAGDVIAQISVGDKAADHNQNGQSHHAAAGFHME